MKTVGTKQWNSNNQNIDKILRKMINISVLMLLLLVLHQLNVQMQKQHQLKLTQAKEQSLLEEIAQCELQLEELVHSYVTNTGFKTGVVLLFDNFAESSYKRVISYMERYSYEGVIIFRDGKVPGEPGAISIELYQELLNKGWEGAIGNSSDITIYNNCPDVSLQKWKMYIKEMQQHFLDKGLEVPKVYVSHRDEAVDEISEQLELLGFVWSARYEDEFSHAVTEGVSLSNREMGMILRYHDYEGLTTDISDIISEGKSVAVLFGKAESGVPKDKYHISVLELERQLERLCMLENYMVIGTFQQYQEYQQDFLESHTGEYENFMRDYKILERHIENLHEDAKDMYR